MFKNTLEEGHAIAKFIRSIAALGKGPVWKRAIVYTIWGAAILVVVVGTPWYLISSLEKQRKQYLNDLYDVGELNQLMIVKDALNVCLESIKTNHDYKKRYCDYSVLKFEKSLAKVDEFFRELIEAKAYEQMVISTDANIRSIDYKALVKRKNITIEERVLDILFTPLGIFTYFFVAFMLLSLPSIVFFVDSKRTKKDANKYLDLLQ